MDKMGYTGFNIIRPNEENNKCDVQVTGKVQFEYNPYTTITHKNKVIVKINMETGETFVDPEEIRVMDGRTLEEYIQDLIAEG